MIEEWNVVHAVSRGIVLLPTGWETHSVHQMGVRPQAHINATVLRDCDILSGIFWHRMGIEPLFHRERVVAHARGQAWSSHRMQGTL